MTLFVWFVRLVGRLVLVWFLWPGSALHAGCGRSVFGRLLGCESALDGAGGPPLALLVSCAPWAVRVDGCLADHCHARERVPPPCNLPAGRNFCCAQAPAARSVGAFSCTLMLFSRHRLALSVWQVYRGCAARQGTSGGSSKMGVLCGTCALRHTNGTKGTKRHTKAQKRSKKYQLIAEIYVTLPQRHINFHEN